jgi:hypothetical protein
MKNMMETWVAEQQDHQQRQPASKSPVVRLQPDWTESEFFQVWLRIARDRKPKMETSSLKECDVSV